MTIPRKDNERRHGKFDKTGFPESTLKALRADLPNTFSIAASFSCSARDKMASIVVCSRSSCFSSLEISLC